MNIFEEIKKLEIEKAWYQKSKSKSMFDDNFFGQIEELMEQIWEMFQDIIIKKFKTEYTSLWNYEAKIKINDPDNFLNKLITIRLTYKKNDIKFWYIHPEILSDEKWQKTRIYKLWKFPIDEHKKIIDNITKKLIETIEEF